uniref:mRNA 5'-phosphatase n=1 Tax=viral metagenome TaxID=1070528 RepID=A0A6C0J2L4_9ZZZZ
MNLEVKPKNWILPNRIGYNKEVYETFNPSKYPFKQESAVCKCTSESCEIDSKAISLFPQQRIIRDYMQFDSPYRGILLYHELGSGKTAASIATAEGYINKKKVFIITPASLSQNYENELINVSKLGLDLKKSWTLLSISKTNTNAIKKINEYGIKSKFIKFNKGVGLVWIPLYKNDIEDSITVKNNIKYSSMISEDKTSIDETISHIIRNRYSFINYNGLTQKKIDELGKDSFNDSFIVIDEVHNFISRVVNGSKLARAIYDLLMTSKNIKMVLLSGTPIINNPYEIASLINLIRGPMKIYDFSISVKKGVILSNTEIIQNLINSDLYDMVDEVYYLENKIFLMLLPDGFKKNKKSNDVHIHKNKWGMTESVLIDKITASLKKIKGIGNTIKKSSKSYYALPNSREEFDKYFIDDTDKDKLIAKNIDLFKRRILGTLSFYRTSGTELFPDVLPRVVRHLDMTNHQLSKYIQVRNKEMRMDEVKKKFNRGAKGGDDKSSVYRAFSRMVCNFAFPENIERVYPADIRKVINIELGVNNDDLLEDKEVDKKELSDKINKKTHNDYTNHLNELLEELVDGNYLDRDNLKKLYSPKYAQMLEDIETCPGSALIYSQFRVIEGLGIFSEVLKKAGYAEIVITKEEGVGYVIEDLEVFDKKYDNKRYVVFNSDRVKTNILMNIFNGDFSLLPDIIQEQLPKDKDQLYGKLVKLMMITQSGAEGISLKNVRRVLIMEYFWNAVRINQVIGRAVRTCSHQKLPKEDQNVGIFIYIMKLNKKQLDNNPTLRKKDNELTTDEHILELANNKESLINIFMNLLKSASMDCIINAIQNKPLENGYKCYNWPINVNNNALSYTADIKQDDKIQKHQKLQKLRSNKGIVVSKDGKKYAVIDNKLYDYFSYINTGVLLPVSKNKSIKKVINIPKIDSFIKEDDLRIFSNKIKKILKNLKITNEAEISIKIPSLEIFNNISEFLKKRKNKISDELLLDIAYGYKKNASYRITINGSDTINKILSNISNIKNNNVFSTLLSYIKQDNISIIDKIRKKVIDDTDNDIRFRLSEENQVDDKKLEELQKLNTNKISFRLKDRQSLLLFEDNIIKISTELTLVKTSKNIKNINNGNITYELEVEILFKKDIKKLDKKYITIFIEEVNNLLKKLNN